MGSISALAADGDPIKCLDPHLLEEAGILKLFKPMTLELGIIQQIPDKIADGSMTSQ